MTLLFVSIIDEFIHKPVFQQFMAQLWLIWTRIFSDSSTRKIQYFMKITVQPLNLFLIFIRAPFRNKLIRSLRLFGNTNHFLDLGNEFQISIYRRWSRP